MAALDTICEQDVRDGDLGALQPEIDLEQWMRSGTELTSASVGGGDEIIHPDGDSNGGIWVMHRNPIDG
jgi:hypothetical protein